MTMRSDDSFGKKTLRVATLAVGTEVTDGQIIDRNSAWISDKVTQAGLAVVEHRAVADDHGDIARALDELSKRADLLFVTGGLGPTSDDFTRDVICRAFNKQLEFDNKSWEQIQSRLQSRGVAVRDIQKQQCFFPQGSRILMNPDGTANAFTFDANLDSHAVRIYALPGPPNEIAAIWQLHLADEIGRMIEPEMREVLHILRCFGRPESEVAEKTEAAILGHGVRVGYRAALPYVEVKLWVPAVRSAELSGVIQAVEDSLGDWVVTKGYEDPVDSFLSALQGYALQAGTPVLIQDSVTDGYLHQRLVDRVRAREFKPDELPFSIETVFSKSRAKVAYDQSGRVLPTLRFFVDESLGGWRVCFEGFGADGKKPESALELPAPKHYNLATDRARKYAAELLFLKMRR